MKISTKGRYALLIMMYLAKHYDENRYITLKEISEKEGIYRVIMSFLMNRYKNEYDIYNMTVTLYDENSQEVSKRPLEDGDLQNIQNPVAVKTARSE